MDRLKNRTLEQKLYEDIVDEVNQICISFGFKPGKKRLKKFVNRIIFDYIEQHSILTLEGNYDEYIELFDGDEKKLHEFVRLEAVKHLYQNRPVEMNDRIVQLIVEEMKKENINEDSDKISPAKLK